MFFLIIKVLCTNLYKNPAGRIDMTVKTKKKRAWLCWSERRAWGSADGHTMIQLFSNLAQGDAVWNLLSVFVVGWWPLMINLNINKTSSDSFTFSPLCNNSLSAFVCCRELTLQGQSHEKMIVTFNYCSQSNFHAKKTNLSTIFVIWCWYFSFKSLIMWD